MDIKKRIETIRDSVLTGDTVDPVAVAEELDTLLHDLAIEAAVSRNDFAEVARLQNGGI
jgi:hypothetical protein